MHEDRLRRGPLRGVEPASGDADLERRLARPHAVVGLALAWPQLAPHRRDVGFAGDQRVEAVQGAQMFPSLAARGTGLRAAEVPHPAIHQGLHAVAADAADGPADGRGRAVRQQGRIERREKALQLRLFLFCLLEGERTEWRYPGDDALPVLAQRETQELLYFLRQRRAGTLVDGDVSGAGADRRDLHQERRLHHVAHELVRIRRELRRQWIARQGRHVGQLEQQRAEGRAIAFVLPPSALLHSALTRSEPRKPAVHQRPHRSVADTAEGT